MQERKYCSLWYNIEMIYGIWAEDENRLIGKNNRLPWNLPAELAHFKKTTMNQAILMGRKTFDGMNKRILPGRQTIILSRDQAYQTENEQILLLSNLTEVLNWYENQDKDLFVIGGSQMFELFEPYFDGIYQTIVHGKFDGDIYFPENFDMDKFDELSSEFHEKDEKNAYDFTVKKYRKKDENA